MRQDESSTGCYEARITVGWWSIWVSSICTGHLLKTSAGMRQMLVLRQHERRLKHDATILQIKEIGIKASKYPLDDDMDEGLRMMQQSPVKMKANLAELETRVHWMELTVCRMRSIPKAETEDNSRFEPGGVGMMLKTPRQRQILMGNWRATWAIARLEADVVAN